MNIMDFLFFLPLAAGGLAGLVSAIVVSRVHLGFGTLFAVLVAAGVLRVFMDARSRPLTNLPERKIYGEVVANGPVFGAGLGFAAGLFVFWRRKP